MTESSKRDRAGAVSPAVDTSVPTTGDAYVVLLYEEAVRIRHAAEVDPLWLFSKQSQVMQLSDTGGREHWVVNDGGWFEPSGTSKLAAAWQRVSLNPIGDMVGLPTSALLFCAWSAFARTIQMRCLGVRFVLPVEMLSPVERPQFVTSAMTAAFVAAAAPADAVRVVINVEATRAIDFTKAEAALLSFLAVNELCAIKVTTTELDVSPGRGLPELGFPPHGGRRAAHWSIGGILNSWSPESIGWVADLLSDMVARNTNYQGPLLVSVLLQPADSVDL